MKIVPLPSSAERMRLVEQRVCDRIDIGWDGGPTAAELDAIEQETPLIDAEVELLDVCIALMDRVPNQMDKRRLRKAVHQVLTARAALSGHRKLPSQAAAHVQAGGAA